MIIRRRRVRLSGIRHSTYTQAMRGPDAHLWKQAMESEFNSMVTHRVGRLVPRPANSNVLGGMWRLKRKRDADGNITAYKAWWVILGNHQVHGVDFFETYASVGTTDSLHTLFAMAADEDLEMESFDIKTAFLTGDADVPIFTIQLKGYKDGSPDVILLDQTGPPPVQRGPQREIRIHRPALHRGRRLALHQACRIIVRAHSHARR